MLLTIWNFTHEPISGFINPEIRTSNRFSIQASKRTPNVPLPSPTQFHLHPHIDFSATLPKGRRKGITLFHPNQDGVSAQADSAAIASANEEVTVATENPAARQSVNVPISVGKKSSWKVLDAAADTPWTLVLNTVAKSQPRLMVFQKRDMASFLSQLPDRLPLSSLLLPGTHDTMSLYGQPISQCQTVPLSTQLQDGIRVIDIRLAVIPAPARGALVPDLVHQHLIAYHGISDQKAPFTTILTDVHNFLTSNSGRSETIIMSIKQEDAANTPPPYFSLMVRGAIMAGPGGWDEQAEAGPGVNHGMWFLENRIPTLGEVRGKVILMSRFGGDGAGWKQQLEGMGIHPTTWPDSPKTAFEWDLKGTTVRTHDWYNITTPANIAEKVDLGVQNLLPPRNSPKPVLPITFFSGSSFPLALPPIVATGIPGIVEGANSLIGKWLIQQIGSFVPPSVTGPPPPDNSIWDGIVGIFRPRPTPGNTHTGASGGQDVGQEPRIRGWAMLDFYSEPSGSRVIPLLVECNFLGRISGEEGW